jgi:tRNA A37 threonylcarbamoyladenosine dehydratase/Tat protein secretion system quality control protein TatD with DNase activity
MRASTFARPASSVQTRRRATRVRRRRRPVPRARVERENEREPPACSLGPSSSSSTFAFEGTARLYGETRFAALERAHVLVVGLGGCGSWAVEALARTGVGALTLVDLDCVCETNVNRQVEATTRTVGTFKCDAMASRVREINPRCNVRVVKDFVQGHNVEDIVERGDGAEARGGETEDAAWTRPDYVLDAIDAERDKAAIAAYCVWARMPLCVTGGAGGVDHMKDVRTDDLANSTFNRLLSATRKTLRKEYAFPKETGGGGSFPGANKGKRKAQGKWGIKCVYAPENENRFKTAGTKGRGGIGCDGVGGSAVFVTGAIGFKAASEIVLDLMDEKRAEAKTDGPASAGWRSRVWPKKPRTRSNAVDSERERARATDATDDAKSNDETKDEKTPEPTKERHDDSSDVADGGRGDIRPTTANSAAARELDASEMYDAHCHWHLDGDHATVRRLCSRLAGAGITTTRPGDWATARAIRSGDDDLTVNVPIAFGVHPWWAHLEKDGKDAWMAELRREIESTPHSVIGEIGLDRVATPPDAAPDYDNQLDCFKRQFALATELGRPVVVHSVKATKDMSDIFRLSPELPPRIFMHSFGGSEDFLRQLIKMKKVGERFYFGFSSVINLRSPKTRAVIGAVPDDRLLLESDLCDPTRAEDELRTMLAIIADIKGWSVRDAARITRENAQRFFGA